MTKSFIKTLFIFTFLLLALTQWASAADLEWRGLYRFEANHIENSELDSGIDSVKDYGLHHLILMPRIVASDGYEIFGKFHLLNNSSYPSSQVGETWGGSGLSTTPTSNDNTSAMGGRQPTSMLEISQLYLTISQEFGAVIVGRAPQHFGLGVSQSAGDGEFDHWYNTRDLVGYKVLIDNFYIYLNYAKLKEDRIDKNGNDISEYNLQFQYENEDNHLEIGATYQMRKSGAGNDLIASQYSGTSVKDLDVNQLGVYAIRNRDQFRWALEMDFDGGKTGVLDANSSNIGLSGFGVAAEFEYRPSSSAFKYGLLTGYASGDDPNTTNSFEGFYFHRNYNVALLLFNHQLGQIDLLDTSRTGGGATSDNHDVDVERVSNATYFAPYMLYQWKPNWIVKGTLATGFLNNDKINSIKVDKDLGYELDLELQYKPNERLTWVNQMGYFMPGSAFKGGSNNYKTNSILAMFSKVAISF